MRTDLPTAAGAVLVVSSTGVKRLPDALSLSLPPAAPIRYPQLPERFLPPPGFVWGSFKTADGATLRWGHMPSSNARAECVMVGGFGECIEKQLETVRDLAARGINVWCFDWRGQGRSTRPARRPTRPRARNFDRDANDLAAFTRAKLTGHLPRVLVAHSMGGAIALLCLRHYPKLFAAAVLSSPMIGLRTGKLPPTLLRVITGPARAAGLGSCFIPGAGKWRQDRLPSPERSRATADAERCRLRHAWFSADPGLRLDEATYGWVDSALALVTRISKPEFLAAIETPILMGQPGREVVVSTAAQRRAAKVLPHCTLVQLRESKHDPFLEQDPIRNYWLSCLDQFIAERLVKTAH
jgi:lysophospholipase